MLKLLEPELLKLHKMQTTLSFIRPSCWILFLRVAIATTTSSQFLASREEIIQNLETEL